MDADMVWGYAEYRENRSDLNSLLITKKGYQNRTSLRMRKLHCRFATKKGARHQCLRRADESADAQATLPFRHKKKGTRHQ